MSSSFFKGTITGLFNFVELHLCQGHTCFYNVFSLWQKSLNIIHMHEPSPICCLFRTVQMTTIIYNFCFHEILVLGCYYFDFLYPFASHYRGIQVGLILVAQIVIFFPSFCPFLLLSFSMIVPFNVVLQNVSL